MSGRLSLKKALGERAYVEFNNLVGRIVKFGHEIERVNRARDKRIAKAKTAALKTTQAREKEISLLMRELYCGLVKYGRAISRVVKKGRVILPAGSFGKQLGQKRVELARTEKFVVKVLEQAGYKAAIKVVKSLKKSWALTRAKKFEALGLGKVAQPQELVVCDKVNHVAAAAPVAELRGRRKNRR